MTGRKLCGFDLNGWRDFAAKNWRSLPGEEEEIGPVDIVQSGPLSSVVQVGEGRQSRWIGGPQADLAPHGRGGGWGAIGSETRRMSVRTLLHPQQGDVGKLSSALLGSAHGSAHTILSISEGPDGGEAVQEYLIDALAAGKFRSGSLVWRPVLAALFAIQQDQVSDGQTVGIACHDRQGISVQKLRIRSTRNVLAPERREAAKLFLCSAGYETLVSRARDAAVGPDGFSARTAHRAIARTVAQAALGMPCEPEILRFLNGDWDILDLSDYDASEAVRMPHAELELAGCDVVFFETLTEGRLKERLAHIIQQAVSVEVKTLPPSAIAQGALAAARRASAAAPIFFDFLPRLSTIVFGSDGARNFDLIRTDETLEAGRTYRSPEPASLAIPAGQTNVSVYLRKEAEAWPRKAKVSLDAALKNQAAVSLWVEQKPAAGRARILMDAPALGRHFTVDWDEAQSDERSWEDIIASLDSQVSIPKRLVLPCGMEAWHDSARSQGLLSLFEIEAREANWASLGQRLSQRPSGKYCVSSDGDIPEEIPPDIIERFDAFTHKALDVTRQRLRQEGDPGTENNDALKFLTWQFRRCPREVAGWLMDCIEKPNQPHPFVRHQASWVLVYQGLGRIISDRMDEARAMRLLLTSSIEHWTWNRQSAAMAFMLSRSDTAPTHLGRADVERLVERTIADFERNIGGEYTMFHYAPFLLAGLIRWRLVNPSALVLGSDPLASKLLDIIDRSERDLSERRHPSAKLDRRRSKFIPILKDLKSELAGEGSNPDLLLDIYGAGGG